MAQRVWPMPCSVERRFVDGLFQVAQLARGAANLHLAGGIDDRDSGRVVAAIFKFAQALDDYRNNLFGADITDNAAHAGALLREVISG